MGSDPSSGGTTLLYEAFWYGAANETQLTPTAPSTHVLKASSWWENRTTLEPLYTGPERSFPLGELLPGAANTGAGRSHQRDRNSDEYLRSNDRAKLFANLSAAAVRPQLEQLYATDLKCLGY